MMSNKKHTILLSKSVVLLLFIFFTGYLLAQDLHFSQYFANPLSYNPANTGFYNGSYRVGLNHKQQWPWAIQGKYLNYNSSAAYADFSILDKRINDTDWAGVGFNFLNDIAGDGSLMANKIYGSFAYHKGLDRYHKHFLSFGATIGFVSRTINFNALYFNNQWVDRVGFDVNIPNNENYDRQKTAYLDLGIGIQGKHQIGKSFNFTYGFSMLHINRPKESFYNQKNRLGIRFLVQSGLDVKLNSSLSLNTSFYFTTQKKAHEVLLSSYASIKLGESEKQQETRLHLGAIYRVKDALSPLAGIEFHRTRLLINYDFNLSSLTKASKGNGGFELSFTHIGTFKRKRNFTHKVYCPKF